MRHRYETGASLLELLLVVSLILVAGAFAAPQLKAYSAEVHLLGAGQAFKAEFMRTRSRAAFGNRYMAIRFETQSDGTWHYSAYADGDGDGVRKDDIAKGIDPRMSGPFLLTTGAPGVRVAVHPGIPAIPPASGTIDPKDPIKFGSSDMVSFSPQGTATPGTFYLAGENGAQAAVRVTPGSARVRLLIRRGSKWMMR